MNIWKSFDCTNVVWSQQEIRVFTRESSGRARSREPRLQEDSSGSALWSQRTQRPSLRTCPETKAHVPSLGLAKLAINES